LQPVRTHVPDAKNPDVLVLVQACADIFDELLLVLHSLLLGLREGHYVDRGKGAVSLARWAEAENLNCAILTDLGTF
jgi:hypothetical protein